MNKLMFAVLVAAAFAAAANAARREIVKFAASGKGVLLCG